MIRALETIGSALTAQRVRLDVIAGNLANASSTMQPDGTVVPYRRRYAVLAADREDGRAGVRVSSVREDPSAFPLRYDPGHPHAIKEGKEAGYVRYPNVNATMEYVDAIEVSRAYEANLAMMSLTRGMIQQSLQLLA